MPTDGLLASLDGEVMPAAQAVIPATDEGLLRGDGVFEVVRLYDGRPFALDDHLERMARSAAGMRLEVDTAAIREDVERLIAAGQLPDRASVRMLVTRGGRRLVLVEELPEPRESVALASVEYVPVRVLDGIKSLSYGANMLAERIAREKGAHHALLVTPHGRVLETPTSAFFCSLDGERLVTPPLEDRILDSITRRRVIALTGATERILTRDDLSGAREAFIASTTREVQAVASVDGAELPDGAPGPLTASAARAFSEHVAAEMAR